MKHLILARMQQYSFTDRYDHLLCVLRRKPGSSPEISQRSQRPRMWVSSSGRRWCWTVTLDHGTLGPNATETLHHHWEQVQTEKYLHCSSSTTIKWIRPLCHLTHCWCVFWLRISRSGPLSSRRRDFTLNWWELTLTEISHLPTASGEFDLSLYQIIVSQLVWPV